ncbi:hypothetical protein TXYLGN1_01270 [Tepidimicrobium xylanilyticum]|nr:hypothetical protein EN5CB1_16020 [Tepidimicrobium xylanilyticum]
MPSSKEEYEFFKKLREYNMPLNDSKKIKLIGIDMEQHVTSSTAYLKSILPKDESSLQIKDSYKSF